MQGVTRIKDSTRHPSRLTIVDLLENEWGLNGTASKPLTCVVNVDGIDWILTNFESLQETTDKEREFLASQIFAGASSFSNAERNYQLSHVRICK